MAMNSSPVMVSFCREVLGQFVELGAVVREDADGLGVLLFHERDDLMVDLRLHVSAEQAREVSPPVLVRDRLERDHAKFFAHAVARDRTAGGFRAAPDVVDAPVEMTPKRTSSAARPPVSVAILFSSSSLVMRVVAPLRPAWWQPSAPDVRGDDGDLLHGAECVCSAATSAWPISW